MPESGSGENPARKKIMKEKAIPSVPDRAVAKPETKKPINLLQVVLPLVDLDVSDVPQKVASKLEKISAAAYNNPDLLGQLIGTVNYVGSKNNSTGLSRDFMMSKDQDEQIVLNTVIEVLSDRKRKIEDVGAPELDITEKFNKDRLPSAEADQRKILIEIVEAIENEQYPLTTGDEEQKKRLGRINSFLKDPNLDRSLEAEVVARLKLHHCFAISVQIGRAKGEDIPGILNQVFSSPESQRWTLEGEDFATLFKEGGLKDLKVAEAFKILQEAHTTGGKGPFEDPTKEKRELAKKLGYVDQESQRKAEKSIELAQRIAKATFETSVWNKKCSQDPLSEAIYFKKWRQSEREKGRSIGPYATINRIDGFGTSFFRMAQTPTGYLFFSDGDHNPKLIVGLSAEERCQIMRERNAGENKDGSINVVNPQELDLQSIKPGEYVKYMLAVSKILNYKSMLLKTNFDVQKDFSQDVVEGYVKNSEIADPSAVLRLNTEFVIGLLWEMYHNVDKARLNGYSDEVLKKLINDLTYKVPTGEGYIQPLITSKQMNWVINEALNKTFKIDVKKHADMATRSGLSGIIKGAFNSAGGKK